MRSADTRPPSSGTGDVVRSSWWWFNSGGWGIRTPEGFHPTRFPSVRHRPLGESSWQDPPRTRQSPVTLAAFPPWGSWPGWRHAGSRGNTIPPACRRRNRAEPARSRWCRLRWASGYRPVSPLPARDLCRAHRSVAGDRSAAHGAAHRSGESRIPVQRPARLRQDDQRAHPGPLPELRRGPHRHPVRRVPFVRGAQPRRLRLARRRRDRRRLAQRRG